MFYSSSSRFLAKRSPPVAAASSANPSEALDCSVPVFGNSFAPAFLAVGLAEDSLVASLKVFSLAITATEPFTKVTTTDPSLLTLISFAVGLAFLTSSATLAFSALVKLLGSVTGVTVGFLTPSDSLTLSADFLTVLSAGITAVVSSLKVTTTDPSLFTLMSFAVGLAFLTSSAILAFSASVKLLESVTGVTAGSVTLLLSASVLGVLTVTLTGTSSLDPSG